MDFGSRMDPGSLLPPSAAERMGQMESLSHRAVLAFVDGDRDELAGTVEKIARWDDEPGRPPYPLPRFDFAVKRVLDAVNTLLDVHDRVGGVDNATLAAGARDLIKEYAPEQYQESALEHLTTVPGGTQAVNLAREGQPADEGTLLVVAAAAAWLATQPNAFPVRQDARQVLLGIIRKGAADAYGTPERERVTSITDQEAREFLDQLFPPAGSYPFPYDPREWTVGEREVIGALKTHLLTTPASATTPEQVRALKGEIITVLQRALAAMEGTAPTQRSAPPSRSGIQPKKDKPKRPKRHKPQRRKK
ncbi:hypothetical protein ACH47Z_28675 [Streptomyces sp. NPDC020192]|uniref:hypothetical protein n=1 Tax=Streptomyces sp. NPDC020192 TaxID=3365066 RepID=UPI00379E3F95